MHETNILSLVLSLLLNLQTPEQKELTLPTAIAAPLPLKELSATTTIEMAAIRYGLNKDHFLAVAKCEDPGLVPDQESNYIRKDGTREPSYGVFMIDREFFPQIPLASSTNVAWASDWAAQQWANGNANWWSCYAVEKSRDWN